MGHQLSSLTHYTQITLFPFLFPTQLEENLAWSNDFKKCCNNQLLDLESLVHPNLQSSFILDHIYIHTVCSIFQYITIMWPCEGYNQRLLLLLHTTFFPSFSRVEVAAVAAFSHPLMQQLLYITHRNHFPWLGQRVNNPPHWKENYSLGRSEYLTKYSLRKLG